MKALKIIKYKLRMLIWVFRSPSVADHDFYKRTGVYRKNPNYEVQYARWLNSEPRKDW